MHLHNRAAKSAHGDVRSLIKKFNPGTRKDGGLFERQPLDGRQRFRRAKWAPAPVLSRPLTLVILIWLGPLLSRDATCHIMQPMPVRILSALFFWSSLKVAYSAASGGFTSFSV